MNELLTNHLPANSAELHDLREDRLPDWVTRLLLNLRRQLRGTRVRLKAANAEILELRNLLYQGDGNSIELTVQDFAERLSVPTEALFAPSFIVGLHRDHLMHRLFTETMYSPEKIAAVLGTAAHTVTAGAQRHARRHGLPSPYDTRAEAAAGKRQCQY